MANVVMAKYNDESKVIAQHKAERDRSNNRRKSATERRRMRRLNQDKQSDDSSDITLVYVR